MVEVNKINEIEKINLLIKKLKETNYEYAYVDDINKLKKDMNIKYTSKINIKLKTGVINDIRDDIIQLKCSQTKRIWYIYYNQNYLFIRGNYKNKLKMLLNTLIDNDFAELTTKTHKNKKEKIITYNIPQKINIEKI
jgi:hypothetical protein